jgi:hypothetical protein
MCPTVAQLIEKESEDAAQYFTVLHTNENISWIMAMSGKGIQQILENSTCWDP